MAIHTLKLIDRKEVAQHIFILVFERPADLNFIPGQYAGFTLINPAEKDAGGITRRFSLLSTPDDPFISIATRMQNSAYKRTLAAMPIGDEIKFAGPTGNFVLHEDAHKPAVFIAGGIGITPFYSMIRYVTENNLARKITLFYGNQSLNDAAFLSELMKLETINHQFKLIATMAQSDHAWQGETGFINDSMIRKYIPDLSTPIYYICGSPVMVTTLQETLAEMGVDENKILIEDFPGY